MTIDDLVALYEAHSTCHKLDQKSHAMRAVVKALRDEMLNDYEHGRGEAWERAELRQWYNEILNDAGGEKVGTHGTPELDEDARKLAALGQDPGATFATDPAPAVCEWADSGGMLWATNCGQSYGAFVSRFGKDAYCPHCDKIIKFSWRPRNE